MNKYFCNIHLQTQKWPYFFHVLQYYLCLGSVSTRYYKQTVKKLQYHHFNTVMFLSVFIWLVCQQDNTETTEWISTKLGWRMVLSPEKTPINLARIQIKELFQKCVLTFFNIVRNLDSELMLWWGSFGQKDKVNLLADTKKKKKSLGRDAIQEWTACIWAGEM